MSDGFVSARNKSNTSIISLQPLKQVQERQRRRQQLQEGNNFNSIITQQTIVTMDSESCYHNYAYTLQKYLLLQEQHEQLCTSLEQIRPRTASTGTLSTFSSPSTSPVRSSIYASAPGRRHSRSGQRRSSRAHGRYNGWEDSLDTIVDEDTIFQISAEEQRLFDVNESIKRALTELLNCDAVRSDMTTRMWAQTRLMETEKELRSGRRRRSSPCRD